jgi:hypothetical protein
VPNVYYEELSMTTDSISLSTTPAKHFLRTLYFSRTAVQIVWAGVVIGTAATAPGLAVALAVLYPIWDVICTIWDLRSNPEPGAKGLQVLNAVLGTATAVAIGLLGTRDPRYAVAAFGAWALAAGLVQLGVGLARRRVVKGQWAMMLSGAQSAAAGTAFLLGGLSGKTHVKDLGGYAIFGAVYFLIAGLLLGRKK